MDKLDLNAYGVSKMTKQEMVEANGGSFIAGFLFGLLAVGGFWLMSNGYEVPTEDGSFNMIHDKSLIA